MFSADGFVAVYEVATLIPSQFARQLQSEAKTSE